MLIDAHTHMDMYEDELDAALREIQEQRIFTITNSMNIPSYERNLEIARRCEFILAIFGVHPWNAGGYAQHLETLKPYVEQSPMLGEIGLDYHFVRHSDCYPDQRKVFEYFLAAAGEAGKIVHLHTKGAESEVLELLDAYGIKRAIVHWYSGPLDIFREMASRGIYFTVGIEVMQSDHIKSIAREIPMDLLLTETDNPGGLKWLTGSPGTPAVIKDVIGTVAALRDTTPEAIIDKVRKNLIGLIGDDPFLIDIRRSLILQ